LFRSHAVDGLFVLRGLFFEFSSEFCDVSFAFLVEFHLRTAKWIRINVRMMDDKLINQPNSYSKKPRIRT